MAFRPKNQKKPKIPTIDLHGYTTEEVWPALDTFLRQASSSGAAHAKIITGKGKGLVKKETKKYLKASGYPSKFEKMDNGKINEGVLIIFLD